MPYFNWRNLNELENLRKDMSRAFDSFSRSVFPEREETTSGWYPLVDIAETKDEFVIAIELPGVSKEDVKINIADNTLTLKGDKKKIKKDDDSKFHRNERYFGTFQRSFSLPSQVNSEKVSANYKDGVLSIVLPKKEEVKPKEISISVG